MCDYSFLYKPRNFKSIEIWRDVTNEEWSNPKWQRKNVIKDVETLSKVIKLTDNQKKEINTVVTKLKQEGKDSLRITPYYATLISEDPFKPNLLAPEKITNRIDPIFWQSVPTPANLLFPNTGIECAMNEGNRSFGAAYQRYPNRVALFVAENTSCASYCIHCQRSKSLDSTVEVGMEEINKGIFYINYNENTNEVLVTGGDALMVKESTLKYILEELSKIGHLRVIRIATRVPVVLPMAITDDLLELINISANKYNRGFPKYVYFMTHINHYNEITEELASAVFKIRKHGFTIRNQTVLLNHVNNYFTTIAETSRRMFWIGIHPYYLLQCHKEKGLVHFITPIQLGISFIKHLQGWISGITLPRYAANIEGGAGKVLLMPSGHSSYEINEDIEENRVERSAIIYTWDGKKVYNYEALGRATPDEYYESLKIMNNFIGREGVFRPKLILIDEKGNHIGTTYITKSHKIDSLKKSEYLKYKIYKDDMPLTNPFEIRNRLEEEFKKSIYSNF